ncbi:uncharacterized protein ARMOST_20377 [Armillaria ostoyae]|uniref:Heterokaryon incompatibility domain-containing protein n=1 Tax=Armillaria ostoyae TaxID=47428 RepID=A0A284S764_ARMOS|nr:uncharacterized protein ARMOST_20377 [Armillaria ostoyae]
MDLQQPTSAVDSEGESDDLSEQMLEDYDDDDEDKSSSGYNTKEEDKSPPQFTLSSLTETGKEESTVPVLKQRSYSGEIPVIPRALADTPCADLGVDGVLEKLNTLLGTSYALDSVISILDFYVAQKSDFGTAYAYLRHYWHDISMMEQYLRANEEQDRKMQGKMLIDGRITLRHVPPRRVWDLCANRVVPYWVAGELLGRPGIARAISHAWVDDGDRMNVMTPINGYEWPVPMPKGVNLDLIRIEMLNWCPKSFIGYTSFSCEFEPGYAWLDILCLRQEGGRGEHLRMEEWKLDVPTIGSVYEDAERVVCYLSGLGRPLNFTLDDLQSDRCWFRRAWTLQEITKDAIIGGETGNDVMDGEVQRRFDEQLTSLWEMIALGRILDLVFEMQNRVSTKPLDKVAGLAYLCDTGSLPIYNAQQSEADAWETLMDAMAPAFRAQLLFFYPMPGDGRKCWRPSWQQLMTNKIIVHQYPMPWWISRVFWTASTDPNWCEGYQIDSAEVRGLSEVPAEKKLRQGELAFKDGHGAPQTLKIVADHAYPIPDGLYTVIACTEYWYPYRNSQVNSWVVGWRRKDGNFEKLSVFRSADDEKAVFAEFGIKHRVKTVLC